MTSPTEPESRPNDRSHPPASWVREPGGEVTLEANWLLSLRKERFRSRRSGRTHDFFVVGLADAVNVIAMTPDRRVVLVEQFRAGSARDSLEPPGGLVDPGEDPLEAGARELREETGYAGDPPVLIGSVWACPSLLTSRITTILITNARPVAEPTCDEGEEVRLELVPAREVPRLIRNGRISHGLAVQGLLWWLVSELPDTPFERPEASHPRDRQVRLGTLMAAVALVAVAIGLVRSVARMETAAGLVVLFGALLLPSYLVVRRLVDPMPRTILTGAMPRYGRRAFLRTLATLGLALILALLVALVLGVGSR